MSEETKNKPDGAKATAKGGEASVQVIQKVGDIPEGLLRFIDDLLEDGATFEDVVETLQEERQTQMSLRVVTGYFRANLDLQKRRVLRQVEKARELKKSLGEPESEEASLADAVFMTGYMGLTRKGAEIKLKDIESIRLSKENLRLRNHVLRQKDRQNRQQKTYRHLRAEVEKSKLEFYKLKSAALKRAMAAEEGQNQLGPETKRAIEEIYGVASIPSFPAEIR